MVAGVVLVVFWITCLYENRVNELKEIPVIRNTLSEINYTELDNFVTENPMAVLYVCKPSDDVCRNFEKKLKPYIEKNNLNNYITYVNLNGIDSFEFFDKFNSLYVSKKPIKESYPAIILFEEGQVKAYIQEKENKPLTVSDVKYFLKINDVGADSE